MAAIGGRIDFMFLAPTPLPPAYPATASATDYCKSYLGITKGMY